MTLYDNFNKQKDLREKLVSKKDDIVKRIEQVDEKIKIIQEDIENLEMGNTLKVIKSKGYSILEVKEALEEGVLDDLLKKNNFL